MIKDGKASDSSLYQKYSAPPNILFLYFTYFFCHINLAEKLKIILL